MNFLKIIFLIFLIDSDPHTPFSRVLRHNYKCLVLRLDHSWCSVPDPGHRKNPTDRKNPEHRKNPTDRKNPKHRKNPTDRKNPGHRKDPTDRKNPEHRKNPTDRKNP